MFVQFVLKNIWDVYSAVNNKYSQATRSAAVGDFPSGADADHLVPHIRNEKMIAKIVKLLELNVPPRDLASNDPQIVKRAVMGAWLPVSTAVLGLVVEHLPSPVAAQKVPRT